MKRRANEVSEELRVRLNSNSANLKYTSNPEGIMEYKTKKSYNPFKMWGSYVGGMTGFVIPWLLFSYMYMDCSIHHDTDCGFALGILFGLAIIFSLVGLILGFLIGWGVHSLTRRTRN